MRLTKQQKGDLVFDALSEASPAGLARGEIINATGLSRGKVGDGIEYVREVLSSMHAEPIVCLRDDDGAYRYYLAASSDAVSEYVHGRLLIAAKQASNLLSGALTPARSKFGDPLHLRLLHKQLRRTVEDLDELVADEESHEDAPSLTLAL